MKCYQNYQLDYLFHHYASTMILNPQVYSPNNTVIPHKTIICHTEIKAYRSSIVIQTVWEANILYETRQGCTLLYHSTDLL